MTSVALPLSTDVVTPSKMALGEAKMLPAPAPALEVEREHLRRTIPDTFPSPRCRTDTFHVTVEPGLALGHANPLISAASLATAHSGLF